MDELVERMSDLASIARKDGMMALKARILPTNFSKRLANAVVDGADEAKLVSQLNPKSKP